MLQPFTDEEQALAECNHELVYLFLKSNRYSIEEYYSIAVMGYLKGIQKYYRNDSIDEDELAGTCWNCMRSEIGNHHKKKHLPESILFSEDEAIAADTAETEAMLYETVDIAMNVMTDRQQDIVGMLMFGYKGWEICKTLHISKSTYYREMNEIKEIFKNESN